MLSRAFSDPMFMLFLMAFALLTVHVTSSPRAWRDWVVVIVWVLGLVVLVWKVLHLVR